MLTEIELADATATWDDLIARVETYGDSFLITRRGMAVARLVPAVESMSVESGLDLLRAVRASSRPGRESLAELIGEGRI